MAKLCEHCENNVGFCQYLHNKNVIENQIIDPDRARFTGNLVRILEQDSRRKKCPNVPPNFAQRTFKYWFNQ